MIRKLHLDTMLCLLNLTLLGTTAKLRLFLPVQLGTAKMETYNPTKTNSNNGTQTHFGSCTVFWVAKTASNRRPRRSMHFASHPKEKANLGTLSPRDSFLSAPACEPAACDGEQLARHDERCQASPQGAQHRGRRRRRP
jgi:hypothetical protein